MAKSKFYDFGPIISRDAMFNFIPGSRGIGKTYGAKKRAIRRAIKTKGARKFIYVRRYKEELALSARTFFNDVKFDFDSYDFRVRGHYAECARADVPAKNQEWFVIGYFIPLSIAQSFKSVSYPDVDTIIFDEFIAEKGRQYLTDEFDLFLNFYNTVDRYDDRVKVFFLANSVSVMNPYFQALNIEPENMGEWRLSNNGYVCVHLPDSSEFVNAAGKSRFGQFIEGSKYAEFAMKNQFADNHELLIARKTPEAMHAFNIESKEEKVSLWFDTSAGGMYYVQTKCPENALTYVLDADLMRDGVLLMPQTDQRRKMLRAAFNRGRVRFDKPRTRNVFIKVIQ